jgi:NitT/TauT family transport system substrate-binding protein
VALHLAVPDMVSPSYFPLIAAVELGFLEREQVEATLDLVFPISAALEDLREGRLDLVGGSAHSPLHVFRDWRGCKLVGALSQNMYWFLVVHAALGAERGDLRAVTGLRIGAAPGPVDGLRRVLEEVGIDPDRDVEIIPVPGTAGRTVSFGVSAADALREGALDGFWANGMGAEIAVRRGDGTVLMDARRGGGPPGSADYTFPAVIATDKSIRTRPEEIAAAVRAVVASQRALRADPSLAMVAAERRFPAYETTLIAELVERDMPFYDATIAEQSVDALNTFGRDIGLLSDEPVPYERIVANKMRSLWS